MLKLFISHSSRDAELVEVLIELFQSALRLASQEIRCTSVDGYRLPAGANTNEQLRQEVHNAKTFVGVISQNSLDSLYVAFELGARWGAGKPLIPLLAPGMSTEALRGPLGGINAVSCDSRAQLHQLVGDLAADLGLEVEQPAAYQRYIERILELTAGNPSSNGSEDTTRKKPTASQKRSRDDFSGAEAVIKEKCEQEWGEDFVMRKNCMRQQRDAVRKLKRGNTRGVPDDIFQSIRAKTAADWPRDYQMRHAAEQQQLDAYEELQAEG